MSDDSDKENKPPLPLRDLMHQGFHSGLRWRPLGTLSLNANGQRIRTSIDLLEFPDSILIARCMESHLPSLKKGFVAVVLADIYDFAAKNVEFCKDNKPQDFFGYIQANHRCFKHLDKDLFWRFTYKLLHARAIFIALHDTLRKVPVQNPLAQALDNFRKAFYDLHPIDHSGDLETQLCNPNLDKRVEYFKYTLATCRGDGTDKVITAPVVHSMRDPFASPYRQLGSKPLDTTEMWCYRYDLGPGTLPFGHTPISLAVNPRRYVDPLSIAAGAWDEDMDADVSASDGDNEMDVDDPIVVWEDAMDIDA